MNAENFHGVGRRKAAVARVWLRRGKGAIVINGRELSEYFTVPSALQSAREPLVLLACEKEFDIAVNVVGGGVRGQADAVKLGIARALLARNESHRPQLRAHGLLTVDARVKERKKYGQRGARAKFQFVKR